MVIDLGNTRMKFALFGGDELLQTRVFDRDEDLPKRWEKSREEWHPKNIVIASTALLSPEEEKWLENHDVLRVGYHLKFPFQIEYRSPETLGQDRLAAVSAADALYRGTNVLIIDCGTCITYDLLLADGIYVGGNIAPGIHMRLKAMHHFTDRLPLVDIPSRVEWIGQSTTGALQSGGAGMAIMEARGFIFYLIEKYGSLRTVLTGGDAALFQGLIPGEHEIQPNLVALGLNEILKNNEV